MIKIRQILLSTIVPACALPALALNVWPRIENMLVAGISSQELGIVLLVSISALGMTSVPFAMAKAPNHGFWWFALIFGIALGTLNYMMAVGAIGKAHDTSTAGVLDKQSRQAHLTEQARSLRDQRKGLEPLRWTTGDMLSSADIAVKLATEARDQECNRVGDHCRARQAQLSTRQSERAELSASHAVTQRAELLDNSIISLQRSLEQLGYVPSISDPQAARISRVVGIFITLGPEDHVRVADFIISFLAIFAEALALGMPRIILTALGRPVEVPALPPRQIALAPVAPKKLAYKPSAPQPSPAPQPPATKEAQPPEGDLAQWIRTNLMKSPNRIKQWEAYTAYRKSHPNPVEFPEFDQAMSISGFQTQVENRKPFYLNTALRTTLKLIA